MKSIFLSVGILIMTFIACQKQSALRLEEVPESVKELIHDDDCVCQPRIGLFKWDERILYLYWSIGPACNTIPFFFDQDGNRVELSAEEQQAFWEEKELIKMIWVCGE